MAGKSSRIVEVIYTFKDKATKKLGKFQKTVKGLTGNIISLGNIGIIGLVTAMGTLITRLASLESRVTDIGNLFNGTKDQLKGVQSAIVDIAKQTGKSATDLADAEFDIVSAGVAIENSFKLLNQSAKLAVAGFTSVKIAANLLTTGLSTYGDEVKSAEELSDKFFQTQVKGKTTIEEISQAFGRVAPTAKEAGFSIDELLGSISALTIKGIITTESVTQLKAAVSAIIGPAEQAKKEAALLGIEFNSSALKAKGLTKFLRDVVTAADGDTESLKKLFGSTEALNGILALSANDFKLLENNIVSIEKSIGATERAFKTKSETLLVQLGKLKEEFFGLGQSLAFVIPLLSGFIAGTIKAINAVKGLGSSLGVLFDKTKRTNAQIKQLDSLIKSSEESLTRLQKKSKDGLLGKINVRMIKKLEERIESLKTKREKLVGISQDQNKTDEINLDILKQQKILADNLAKAKKAAITDGPSPREIEKSKEAVKELIRQEQIRRNKELELAEFTTERKIQFLNKELEIVKENSAIHIALTKEIESIQDEQAEERIKQFQELKDFFVNDLSRGVSQGNLNISDSFKKLSQEIQRNLIKKALNGLIVKLSSLLNLTSRFGGSGKEGGKKSGIKESGIVSTSLAFVPVVGPVLSGISKLFGFAQGGIIGGQEPSVKGDNTVFSGRSGEMVLTKDQQTRLFQLANSGGNDVLSSSQSTQMIVKNEVIILTDNGEELTRGISRKLIELKNTGQVDENAV